MTFKPSPFLISSTVIVITHLVGIVGFLSPWRDLFITITPFHLVISAGLLLYHHSEKNRTFAITIAGLVTAGYLVELAGIQTGVIFGAYHYERALGPKLFDTPPLIGVNWMMLIVAIGSLLSQLKIPLLIKAMLGALCMVAIDLLIEPVAMAHEFWDWERNTVPTHNYLGWLVTAFILFLAYFQTPFKKFNPIAWLLLLMQVIFFGSLNLFL